MLRPSHKPITMKDTQLARGPPCMGGPPFRGPPIWDLLFRGQPIWGPLFRGPPIRGPPPPTWGLVACSGAKLLSHRQRAPSSVEIRQQLAVQKIGRGDLLTNMVTNHERLDETKLIALLTNPYPSVGAWIQTLTHAYANTKL